MSAPLPALDRQQQTYDELGPAMRALPNDRWRAFVEFYLLEILTNGNKDVTALMDSARRRRGPTLLRIIASA
jgi:hypothetical protein